MIMILAVIFLALFIIFVCIDFDEIGAFLLAPFLLCFLYSCYLGICVANGVVIDDKIAMYQEENEKIEEQMDALVSQYMEYESDTYGELKNDSSITLISLYPELKADELVKEQISVYITNNEKIKELKEDKINLKTKKWLLYFGH